jgi:DNA-directed RNA polymerase subunit RPC12/RpoP
MGSEKEKYNYKEPFGKDALALKIGKKIANKMRKAKKKQILVCPDCEEPLEWVELGEPEGDLYKCKNCGEEFDKEGNELN